MQLVVEKVFICINFRGGLASKKMFANAGSNIEADPM